MCNKLNRVGKQGIWMYKKIYRKREEISYSAANTLVRYLRCLSLLKSIWETLDMLSCTGKPPELETMFSSSCPKLKLVSPSVPVEVSLSMSYLPSTFLLEDVARTWRVPTCVLVKA